MMSAPPSRADGPGRLPAATEEDALVRAQAQENLTSQQNSVCEIAAIISRPSVPISSKKIQHSGIQLAHLAACPDSVHKPAIPHRPMKRSPERAPSRAPNTKPKATT